MQQDPQTAPHQAPTGSPVTPEVLTESDTPSAKAVDTAQADYSGALSQSYDRYEGYNTLPVGTLINRTPWDQYQSSRKYQTSATDKYKVHISLDQNPENLQKAIPIIVDLLVKYGVRSFKVIGYLGDGRFEPGGGNLNGKEVTVYMQRDTPPENDPQFWLELWSKIETELKKARVQFNQHHQPQGDKLFPGSQGYIYYRNCENIFGEYVEADNLRFYGFTAAEAFAIGTDMFFEDWFPATVHLHHSCVAVNDQKEPCIQPPKRTIRTTINHEILAATDAIQLEKQFLQAVDPLASPAYDIFFGDYIHRLSANKNLLLHIIGYSLKIPALQENQLPWKNLFHPFFQDCLKEAAQIASLIAANIKQSPAGNISPAIYYHFLKPLLIALRNNQAPHINLIDREALIKNIVKCSFRRARHFESGFAQIHFQEPQYVGSLDDAQLEDMFDQIYRRTTNPEIADHSDIDDNFEHPILDDPKVVTPPLLAVHTLHNESPDVNKIPASSNELFLFDDHEEEENDKKFYDNQKLPSFIEENDGKKLPLSSQFSFLSFREHEKYYDNHDRALLSFVEEKMSNNNLLPMGMDKQIDAKQSRADDLIELIPIARGDKQIKEDKNIGDAHIKQSELIDKIIKIMHEKGITIRQIQQLILEINKEDNNRNNLEEPKNKAPIQLIQTIPEVRLPSVQATQERRFFMPINNVPNDGASSSANVRAPQSASPTPPSEPSSTSPKCIIL